MKTKTIALRELIPSTLHRIESLDQRIVLHPATEFGPWAMTGGLADVPYELLPHLNKFGYTGMPVLPFYNSFKTFPLGLTTLFSDMPVDYAGQRYLTNVLRGRFPGSTHDAIFIDQPSLFSDRLGTPYFDDKGNIFLDSQERYSYFGRAFWEFLIRWDKQPDIVHAHDWHMGPLTALREIYDIGNPKLRDIQTVFTIHNIKMHGDFPPDAITRLGFDDPRYSSPDYFMHYGQANFLKMGLTTADFVTTVSENHAREVIDPKNNEHFKGMSGLMQFLYSQGIFRGLTLGINEEQWNPATYISDAYKYTNFDGGTLSLRARNTKELLSTFGLKYDPAIPVFGFLGRLDEQKGVMPLLESVERMLGKNRPFQFLLVGPSNPFYEEKINSLRDKIGIHDWANADLVHLFMSGVNFLVIPSLYEPCGRVQIQAERSGAIPIASPVGGHINTISGYQSSDQPGTGYFLRGSQVDHISEGFEWGLDVWKDQSVYHRMQSNAMTLPFSWDNHARQLHEIYQGLLAGTIGRRAPGAK